MVGEIQFKFEQRGEMHQLSAQRSELFTEITAHLAHRHLVTRGSSGGDDVCHGFRLRQVHLTIEKSALRKFARSSGFTTCGKEQLHHALEDVGRTVTRNLGSIFSCVRMGSSKKTHQHFIDDFVVFIDDVPKGERTCFAFAQWFAIDGSKYLFCDGNGL